MSTAMDIVKKARMVSRPTTLEFIDKIFTDFVELHGDRHFADDKAIVGGIAFLDEIPVTVIGVQKGHSLQENMNRNFGTPHPEGYRKQLRLMKQAEKFGRPIILFVNTSGAYCGIGAEERGQGEAIARNLMEMAGIKVPIISIFIGEGGSGGALALALADVVWMLDNGMYAVLSPEGFSSILWRSPERVEDAATLMKLTAKDLLKNGVIDEVIPESENGIANELSVTTDRLHQRLSEEVKRLLSMKDDELLEQRYERFRKFGDYTE